MTASPVVPRKDAPEVAVPPEAGLDWRRAVSWSLRSGAVLLEQALYSGTHFLLGILLLRLLPPAEYGAFGIAFALFLLASTLHSSLLTEGALVFGGGRYRERFADYVGMLLGLHVGLAVPIVLFLAATALVVGMAGDVELKRGLFAFALASPFLLLYWLVRRLCYVPMRLGLGLAATGLYAVLMLGGMGLWGWLGELTVPRALLLMAGAAVAASTAVLVGLRPRLAFSPSLGGGWMEVMRAHLRYGGWFAFASGLHWLQGQVPLLFTGWLLDLEAAAVYRAYFNFFLPLPLLLVALNGLMVSKAAHLRRIQGVGAVGRVAHLWTFVAVIACGFYALIVVMARKPLAHLILGPVYAPHADLLLFLMPTLVLFASNSGAGVAIRACERSDLLIPATASGVVASAALAAGLIPLAGVAGAMLALAGTQLVTTAAVNLAAYRLLEKGTGGASSHPHTRDGVPHDSLDLPRSPSACGTPIPLPEVR